LKAYANIHWIRTLQYFGRKLIDSGKPLSATGAGYRYALLAPLLNIVVTLDPHHVPAYRFGAIFLPERDIPAAIELLERGIRENPNEWRLYQDLAYIYWQQRECRKSRRQADLLRESRRLVRSRKPGARFSLVDARPRGVMRIKGGSRDAARLIYEGYLTSDDRNISAQAVERFEAAPLARRSGHNQLGPRKVEAKSGFVSVGSASTCANPPIDEHPGR
jgi:hypothetical protein